MSDFRFALRGLIRTPGFTLVAVLSLALGIGANTAIFSLIDAVMLRALPVPEPDELALVTFADQQPSQVTIPIWEELRERQDVFSGTFAYAEETFDGSTGGESRPIAGNLVSGDFFSTLGLTPAVGRLISAADDRPGCAATAVLGHGFWQNEYGGDRGVVGRTIPLNGYEFEVLGVAPAGFFGFNVGSSAQVYVPLCALPLVTAAAAGTNLSAFWFLRVGGRLRNGLGIDQASARLGVLAPSIYAATVPTSWNEAMQADYRQGSLGAVMAANGYSDVRNGYRQALTVLMAVVGLVLLIACANVANLLMARATARGREIAVRMAVGAGRLRLVRQLLSESLLLAIAGALTGLLFAGWATGLLLRLLSSGPYPVTLDVSLNVKVLGFTAAVAAATTILFGLLPAWRATKVDPQLAMKATDRTIAPGHTRFSAGKALVIAQVAVSLVLVIAAGLLLGTLQRLANVETGFVSDGVLVAAVDMRKAEMGEERLVAAKREVLEQLRASPGVVGASASIILPMSGVGWNGHIAVDGFEAEDQRDALVFFNAVADDYFATMRTPLLAGREFTARDGADSPPVAVINEALAQKFFPGRNPVGERVGLTHPGEQRVDRYVEVVGVVRDTKYRSLREATVPLMYRPLSQEGSGAMLQVQLRGAAGASTLMPTVEAVAQQIDPRISLTFSILSERIAASIAGERALATLAGIFGGLAVLLTVVGLYGTISYNVARRRTEIGVRMALGAERVDLLRMVLLEVLRLLAVGLVVGAVLSLTTTRLLTSFLYGLSPRDPVTAGVAVLLLSGVALAAGMLPALRAAKVDPMVALRAE